MVLIEDAEATESSEDAAGVEDEDIKRASPEKDKRTRSRDRKDRERSRDRRDKSRDRRDKSRDRKDRDREDRREGQKALQGPRRGRREPLPQGVAARRDMMFGINARKDPIIFV